MLRAVRLLLPGLLALALAGCTSGAVHILSDASSDDASPGGDGGPNRDTSPGHDASPGRDAALGDAGRSVDGGPLTVPATLVVCGSAVLQSPYNYTGAAGPYTSGTARLPTFGSAGSDFPNDTSGVVVGPGSIDLGSYQAANTLYYFEPGPYTITGSASPGTNTAYVGGYSGGSFAVWDGASTQASAVLGTAATGVYIEYLTIQNFSPTGNRAVLNDTGKGKSWTVKFDTVQNNGYSNDGTGTLTGNGMQLASHDDVEYNCITKNGVLGINAAQLTAADNSFVGPIVSHNEISLNGYAMWPDDKGCGCSGGVKFWQSWNSIFDDNYVHNNWLMGVWWDTNNTGMEAKGNWFQDDMASGIDIELGYNGDIEDNMFIDEGFGAQHGAIYCNLCGGDNGQVSGSLTSNFLNTFTIKNNTIVNSWEGIEIFGQTGRTCAGGQLGLYGMGSDGVCTLQPADWPQFLNLPVTTTAGAGGLSAGTLRVSSTSGFTFPGWIKVGTSLGPTFYYYTGLGTGTLTGVSLVNGAGAPASGNTVDEVYGCEAAYGLGQSATSPGSGRTYWDLCNWPNTKNITVSGNTISFNQATATAMQNTIYACTSHNGCGTSGMTGFAAGGGAAPSISPSQPAVDVTTFTGTQKILVTDSSTAPQSIGWISVQTSSGLAWLSYNGITGNSLDNVQYQSGSGTLTPGSSGGYSSLGMECGGPFLTCNNLVLYQVQNNVTWAGNTYYGGAFRSWQWSNGNMATDWAAWSGKPAGSCTYPNGCNTPFGEDSHGAYEPSGGPYWNRPAGNPTGVHFGGG